MSKAKFEIKRKCEVCGKVFMAATLESRYCSRRCTNIAYKQRKVKKAEQERLQKIAESVPDARDYITVQEAVAMFNVSRGTIYRLIHEGSVPAINVGQRLTRISKSSCIALFTTRDFNPPKVVLGDGIYNMNPDHCYTIGEISKKFDIDDSTVWSHIRKYSIPTRQIGNYVYAPKSEIDKLYSSL